MIKHILVTGSHGFIGKHLVSNLRKNPFLQVLEFNRKDSLQELEELLLKSDIVYHLAGEVRPQSEDKEFVSSNVELTQFIVDFLEKQNHSIPIIYASSIHATLCKNTYGKTKKESEDLIKEYTDKAKVASVIVRLPHLFGDGCKANYNSAITTWIVNSVSDKEITVYDRDIKIEYAYVHDVIDEFIDYLNVKKDNIPLYQNLTLTYDTILGEIVDYLEEFKNNINALEHINVDKEFKKKLLETYQKYTLLQEG